MYHIIVLLAASYAFLNMKLNMGGSPGDVSENSVT